MSHLYFSNESKGAKYPIAVEMDSDKYVYIHKKKDSEEDTIDVHEYERFLKSQGVSVRDRYLLMQQHFEDTSSRFKASQKLVPVLRRNYFDVVHITGRSGAGKTKTVIRMVNAYCNTLSKKEQPDIFLISIKDNDVMIDSGNPKNKRKLDRGLLKRGMQRVDVETFLEQPLKISEVPDHSIIIFDDYEQYASNKKLFALIQSFLNNLITLGRTKFFKVFIISHNYTLGKDSTLTFIEATWFVVNPSKMPSYVVEALLMKKIGLSRNTINRIKGLKRLYLQKNDMIGIWDKTVELLN